MFINKYKMKFFLVLASLLSPVSSMAADACAGYPRIAAIPPMSTNLNIQFRDSGSQVLSSGEARGFTLWVTINVTNVGTLTQDVYAELNDVDANAYINNNDVTYAPPGWTKKPGNMLVSMYGHYDETKVPMMQRKISIAPGKTQIITLGLQCKFESNLGSCSDLGIVYLGVFHPDYGAAGPPVAARINVSIGGRICVKGPAKKEYLGAIMTTAQMSTELVGLAPAGSYVDDTMSQSTIQFTLVSGLGF
jgi:hypothetical protein